MRALRRDAARSKYQATQAIPPHPALKSRERRLPVVDVRNDCGSDPVHDRADLTVHDRRPQADVRHERRVAGLRAVVRRRFAAAARVRINLDPRMPFVLRPASVVPLAPPAFAMPRAAWAAS
jgi:hypothetical protein